MRRRIRFSKALLPILLLALLLSAAAAHPAVRGAASTWLAKRTVWSRAILPDAWPDQQQWARFPVYRVEADLNPEALTLTGTVHLRFTNPGEEPLEALYLRTMAKALGPADQGDAFRLRDLRVDGRAADFTLGETLITVPLPEPLRPGRSVDLSFAFSERVARMEEERGYARTGPPAGDVPDYRPVMAEFQGATDTMILLDSPFPQVLRGGQLGHETDALPPEGAVDLPDFALYEVSLTLPEGWTLISNGVPLEEQPAGEGRRTVRIAAGPIYQFSFLAATGLERVTREVGDVTIHSYAPPDRMKYGEKVAEEAAQAYALYREALGPLPYPELNYVYMDHLTGPLGAQFGGALIGLRWEMYSDRKRPLDPWFPEPVLAPIQEIDWEANRRRVIFHETSHYWWGSISRSDQHSPWVTEAMANAMTFWGLEQVYGAELADWVRSQSTVRYGLMRFSGLPDVPVQTPIDGFESLSHRTVILYDKGALFFDALRKEIGDAPFFDALRAHLERYRYGYSTPEGPVPELLSHSGHREAVQRLYDRWVRGVHADEDIGVIQLKDPGVAASVRQSFRR